MPCLSCVDKLASKLITNHPKLDWIRAQELASKGVERVASREKPKKIIMVVDGDEVDPDYTKPCYNQTCYGHTDTCVVPMDCYHCECDVGAQLPHSHLVANNCSNTTPCVCVKDLCGDIGTNCNTLGSCGYDCDSGYHLEGSECVPDVAGQPYISRVQRIEGMRTWGGH